MSPYVAILVVGVSTVVLAALAYMQRALRVADNRLRERQLALTRAGNRLARARVHRLNAQIALLNEIRDQLTDRAEAEEPRPSVVGVVDVGSLSIRLQVGRHDAQSGRLERLDSKRYHEGLGAEAERFGEYRPETLARVGKRVGRLVERAERLGCERLAIVVTAPCRSGANPHELLEAIRDASGREPCPLSPQREAEFAFVGATMSSSLAPRDAVVFDVGGGSTEVATGSTHDGIDTASFRIGAFTLAERWGDHWPPGADDIASARRDAERQIGLRRRFTSHVVLAAGGSARAAARLASPILGRAELADALEKAVSGPPPTKRELRRRSLPAGIVILQVLHSRLDVPLTVASGGLREGVLLELAGVSPELPPDRLREPDDTGAPA